MTLIDLLPIRSIAPAAIEALLDEAFGADRHGRTAYRLRAGTQAVDACSFAAIEDGALVGSIQCWPVQLRDASGGICDLILVGPIAVRPDRQRDGIGRLLTHAALEVADQTRSEPLVLIGDPEYYQRFFGFEAGPTASWTLPGPVDRRRLLVRVRSGQALPISAELGPRVAATLVRDAH